MCHSTTPEIVGSGSVSGSGSRNDLCNELKKMKVVHFHILIALLS